MTLFDEAQALEPNAGPWLRDTTENAGKNWMLADMGESHTGAHIIVTTDGINGGAMNGASPEDDADFIVWCRNHWDDIKGALMQASASYEEAGL